MKLKLFVPALLLAAALAATAAEQPAAVPAPAAPKKPAQPEEGHRYLFLIDASADMAKARDATADLVEGLLLSGMNEELRTGDAFALWPYRGEVVNDSFPPETWFAELKEEHAATAKEFVTKLKFEGKSSLAKAVGEMLGVVAASHSVTVFLISDGAEAMRGTPFDLYANTIYRDQGEAMRKANKPFVTSFLAVEGKIIDCLITAGGEKVVAPKIPEAARKRPAPAKPMVKAAPAPVAPVAPKSPPPSIIVLKPKPEAAAETTVTVVAKPEAAPAPVKPVVIPPATVMITSTTAGGSALAIPMTLAKMEPPGKAPAPPPKPEPAPPKPADTAATVAVPAPSNAAAVGALAVTPAVPQGMLSRRGMLAIGLALLGLAGWLVWLMTRSGRSSTGPSLITRSMGK